jgi:glycosyltransferase involved in cell wall biosynthesis
MLSILIPARNEQFLAPTVEDIFAKATGHIEVVVHLDGYLPDPPLKVRSGLRIVYSPEAIGMRPGINAAALAASGDHFLKCDAHCLFEEGFDEVLLEDYQDNNWVMVPRRYSLDAEEWCKTPKAPKDYHYLSYPFHRNNNGNLHGRWWKERGHLHKDLLIDDEMTSQGSCWLMSRHHFWDFLGGLRVKGYGDFIQEFQEIGMKTWLGGGAVKVNKRTWYAHLHKGKRYGRGYYVSRRSWNAGLAYSTDYWLNNKWEQRLHDFDWLIDKFWPIPTWPQDWREQLATHKTAHS